MGKALCRNVPWLKIKADFLIQIPPRDLAVKYKVPKKVISDRANQEGWVTEKTKIYENVRISVEDEIKQGARESVAFLRSVVNNEEEDTKDRISAAKGILDVSGMKSSKQEITGKDGAPLTVQKEYILPEEVKDFEKHYNQSVGK